jgi:hypothetical protein
MAAGDALAAPESGGDGFQGFPDTWFGRHPAWPITALLVGWPIWWLMGICVYIPIVFAIPCAVTMYRWRATHTRRIKVPPAFGIWLLFILVTICGIATLSLTAPDTLVSSTSNRLVSWTLRTISYLAATAILLYAGNLTERELPRRRLAWQLGLVGLYTVAGGIGGMVLPTFQITSPLALVVPQSILASNNTLAQMLHPSTAQVQNFLGYAEGRPTAPFTYTNMWGNALAILLPWLFVAWYSYGNSRQKKLCLAILVIAVAPLVYSLDRGLWVGVGVMIVYLAVRLAARGKLLPLGVLCGALALAAVVIMFSPLGDLIGQRLAHGKSNQGRSNHSSIALEAGLASPILGYGDTRHQAGSATSIQVGRTANCKTCGNSVIGGDGQMQTLLICSGVTGALLYCGFFGYGVWRYRRDPTAYGMAGIMVIVLGFIFMFVYIAVGPPLVFTMLAYSLLWRNEPHWRAEKQRKLAETESASFTGPPLPAGDGRRGITAGPVT